MYFEDCTNIFGRHCYGGPYSGMRGRRTREMNGSIKEEQDLHFKEFESYIIGFDSAEEG